MVVMLVNSMRAHGAIILFRGRSGFDSLCFGVKLVLTIEGLTSSSMRADNSLSPGSSLFSISAKIGSNKLSING